MTRPSRTRSGAVTTAPPACRVAATRGSRTPLAVANHSASALAMSKTLPGAGPATPQLSGATTPGVGVRSAATVVPSIRRSGHPVLRTSTLGCVGPSSAMRWAMPLTSAVGTVATTVARVAAAAVASSPPMVTSRLPICTRGW